MYQKIKNSRTFLISSSALLILGIFYFYCLPDSVQGGDTGEMATNPHFLRLLHPPGFPVYFWLQYCFTHLVPLFTLFKRSALLSLASALLSFLLLAKQQKNLRLNLLTWAYIFCLASSQLVWKFSVLPEVFLPEIALLSCCIYLCQRKRPASSTLFYALALGLHPTAVFLFPVWFWNIPREKRILLLGAWGLMVPLLYATLCFATGSGSYAWNHFHTFSEFFAYITRADYGALKLAASEQRFLLGENLLFFCTRSFPILLASAFVLAVAGIRSLPKFLAFTLLGYLLIFFSLANVEPKYLAGETIARFHLFPLFLIAWMVVPQLSLIKETWHTALGLALVAVTLLQISYYWQDNDYSHKKVIEEFAENMLKEFPAKNSCSALFVKSDAIYVALNYVQGAKQIRPDVLVVADGFLGLEWYRKFLKESGLKINDQAGIPKHYTNDILKPNLPRCEIHAEFYDNSAELLVTYLPASRKLSLGQGVSWQSIAAPTLTTEPHATLFYDIEKRVFARYADYFLMQSLLFEQQQQYIPAKEPLKRALTLVPYCSFAWSRLCQIETHLKEANLDSCGRAAQFDPYCDPRRP